MVWVSDPILSLWGQGGGWWGGWWVWAGQESLCALGSSTPGLSQRAHIMPIVTWVHKRGPICESLTTSAEQWWEITTICAGVMLRQEGRGQHTTFKRMTAVGYDINWLEPIRSKMAEDSTSSGPWASLYPHFNTLAKWHALRHHDSSEADYKRPKSGQWPNSWKSPPHPQNSWSNPLTC